MEMVKAHKKVFVACLTTWIALLLYFVVITDNQDSNYFSKVFRNISEYCNCSRTSMFSPSHDLKRLNSSCSDEATFYTSGQNVVSFSFFISNNENGDLQEEYRQGLLQNLEMMRKHYPGYSLRLYTDRFPSKYYCDLLCKNSDLFWCNINFTPSHADLSGMVFRTWRFLTLGDPTVDIFLSRDLDSLISAREAAVVKDWLYEGAKGISLMRDRAVGHNVPILAGMWQASNKILGMDIASDLRGKIISSSKAKEEHDYKSSDQKILDKILFYPMAKDIIAYDAYNCVKWGNFTDVRPFPTKRGDPCRDFVGNIVDFVNGGGLHNYTENVCPVECRPEYGKDWIYC